MKLIKNFVDACADELDELLVNVADSNNIDHMDEDFVYEILVQYTYCKIKAYVWFLLSVMASAMAIICILSQSIAPSIPKPARIAISLAIIFRIPMNKTQIRDYVMEKFGKDTVEYFKSHRDSWHIKNDDDSKEE